MIFSVVVDDSGFKELVNKFQQISYVVKTVFSNFASVLEMNTREYVPLRTGELEDSFRWSINSTSKFVELNVGYSAISDNGFEYSVIQHEKEFNHPLRGTDHYLADGIRDSTGAFFVMMETDFLSLFGG